MDTKLDLKTVIDIKALLCDTLDAINQSEDYMRLIKHEQHLNKKTPLLSMIFDSEMGYIAEKKYPELEFTHPDDDCVLGDIYSKKLDTGIELKVCQGQGKANQTVWENGTIQDHSKYFLFVRTSYVDGKVIIKFAYYGYMSYSEWRIHGKGLNIGPKKVRKFCEQIM